MIPIARNTDLVIQNSGDELLVYDLRTNKAVCLNRLSAIIWRSCDGEKSPFEIREALESKFGKEVSEELVWFALEQLYNENLLDNDDDFVERYRGISRRSIIKKIGLGSAVALPIVASLTAPLAVNAQSVAACTPLVGGCTCAMGMAPIGSPCPPGDIITPCAEPSCTCLKQNNSGAAGSGDCIP